MPRRRGIGTGSMVGRDFQRKQNRERADLISRGIADGTLDDSWVVRVTETRQSTQNIRGESIPYTHAEMVPVENAEQFKHYQDLGSSKDTTDYETGDPISSGKIINTKFYILGLIGRGGSYRIGDLKEEHGASNVAAALTEGLMKGLIEVTQ
tara:strand:- start:167 stop:622 length:456 start_codon:yes stop_codon:yes gene_type:complete